MAGFAPVSAARGLVHVSGVVPSRATLGDPIERQVEDVLGRLDRTLREAGSSLARALSLHVQVRHASAFGAMNAAYARFFAADPPARTTVVAPPEMPGALVEISGVAAAASASREVIRPADWQPSPNPYSYAVRSGDLVFLSGLVPRDGRTNAVATGDLPTQLGVIFDNATDVLAAAGLSLADVVSGRVFLTDAGHASAIDAEYLRRMPAPRPARSTAVARLMNPSYLVEMTFVAFAGARRCLPSGAVDDGQAVQSRAMATASHLFLSATQGLDGDTGLDAQVGGAAAALGTTLREAGLDWSHVVELSVHVADPVDAAPARGMLRDVMARPLPVGTTLICGFVPEGARAQLMATAAWP